MKSQGLVVIGSYQPKPGKKEALIALVEQHVPLLRELGLATGYPRQVMEAPSGAIIEIFEWASEDAARKAHDHPEVRKMWEKYASLCDIVPLSSVTEAQKPFAHFKSVENPRTNRIVHFEIEADDPAKVSRFYQEAFDWQFHEWMPGEYFLADTGNQPFPGIDGGIMKRKQPETGVTNILHVENLDAAIKKVEKAGGKLCKPKFAVPTVGYLAYALDPEQNVFGMMEFDPSAT